MKQISLLLQFQTQKQNEIQTLIGFVKRLINTQNVTYITAQSTGSLRVTCTNDNKEQ